jgi:hypothetical protein
MPMRIARVSMPSSSKRMIGEGMANQRNRCKYSDFRLQMRAEMTVGPAVGYWRSSERAYR